MIGVPPSDTGAVHDTVACPSPGAAITPEGTSGTFAGVTAPDGADGTPVPAALFAVTVNVYAVPFVRPATDTEVAPVVLAVAPSGDAVTV